MGITGLDGSYQEPCISFSKCCGKPVFCGKPVHGKKDLHQYILQFVIVKTDIHELVWMYTERKNRTVVVLLYPPQLLQSNSGICGKRCKHTVCQRGLCRVRQHTFCRVDQGFGARSFAGVVTNAGSCADACTRVENGCVGAAQQLRHRTHFESQSGVGVEVFGRVDGGVARTSSHGGVDHPLRWCESVGGG